MVFILFIFIFSLSIGLFEICRIIVDFFVRSTANAEDYVIIGPQNFKEAVL